MQIKAHPLHVSRSHHHTCKCTDVHKSSCLCKSVNSPWAQSFRDPFAHPDFKTTAMCTQKKKKKNTPTCWNTCAAGMMQLHYFSEVAFQFHGSCSRKCVWVCLCEGGIHHDTSHLHLGQSIKFELGKPEEHNSDGAKSNMFIYFHKHLTDRYRNKREKAEKWEIKLLIWRLFMWHLWHRPRRRK